MDCFGWAASGRNTSVSHVTASPATTSSATTSPATTSPATTSPATASPATARPAIARPATASPATARPATLPSPFQSPRSLPPLHRPMDSMALVAAGEGHSGSAAVSAFSSWPVDCLRGEGRRVVRRRGVDEGRVGCEVVGRGVESATSFFLSVSAALCWKRRVVPSPPPHCRRRPRRFHCRTASLQRCERRRLFSFRHLFFPIHSFRAPPSSMECDGHRPTSPSPRPLTLLLR